MDQVNFIDEAKKRVHDDLFMAIMCGPLSGVKDRVEAAINRASETMYMAAVKQMEQAFKGRFTAKDFMDREGQQASPEAAAKIANQAIEDFRISDLS